MLSITALAGVPALVRDAFGEKVLRAANREAMLDIELIEDRDCFIPHATMLRFIVEIERRAREPHLGLTLAPHLSIAAYGCWGEYLLGAKTLGAAIARSMDAIGYHSRGDRTALSIKSGVARFAYLSAARGREGYDHVALSAIGVILSLCRNYLPPSWRPLRIGLDIPRPRSATPFEDVFGCPVLFEEPEAAIHFSAELLDVCGPSRRLPRLLTLQDVARARLEPASRTDFVGVISAQIRTQVLGRAVSVDDAARSLDMSVRSLQRVLHREGTDFRTLANAIRAGRAAELLAGTDVSITAIATDLGYSTPANFARAFRKATGQAPHDFRGRSRS